MMNPFRWIGVILFLATLITGVVIYTIARHPSVPEDEDSPLLPPRLLSPSEPSTANTSGEPTEHALPEAQETTTSSSSISLSKAQRIQELFERLAREGVDMTYGPHPEEVAIMTEGMDSLSAAKFLREHGVFNYALEYAERAVTENPNSYEALLLKAQLIPLDDPEKEAAYRQLLGMDPNSVEALAGLGSALKYSDRPWEGIPYLQQAIAMDPVASGSGTYYSLGVIYEKLGRYDEAITAYEKAYQIKPISEFQAHIQKIREGNPFYTPIPYPSQEESSEDDTSTSPPANEPPESRQEAPTLSSEGASEQTIPEDNSDRERESSQREDAQAWYQRLMQEDREGLSRAHYEYAREMLKAGRLEEAAEDLHRAIELNPKHTDSYRELANVYERMEEYERAAMVYQQALKQFPKDERLRRNWETFRDKHLREEAPKRPEPDKRK